MRKSAFNPLVASKKYPPPCQQLSIVDYKVDNYPKDSLYPMFRKLNISRSSMVLTLKYADQIRLITQSRLVDGQTLIGYIGGYVGLLLGMLFMLYKVTVFDV